MKSSRIGDARALAHFVLWFVLIGAFLWISAPRIFVEASKFSIQVAGNPHHSGDTFLHEDGGSQRLVALFESTPSSQSVIIFVSHKDQNSASLGMLAAYLAWPHPVRIVDAAQFAWSNQSAVDELRAAAAIAFCGIDPPPSWPRGEQIGDTVRLLPIHRVAGR